VFQQQNNEKTSIPPAGVMWITPQRCSP
jgi:hypothetical protein